MLQGRIELTSRENTYLMGVPEEFVHGQQGVRLDFCPHCRAGAGGLTAEGTIPFGLLSVRCKRLVSG